MLKSLSVFAMLLGLGLFTVGCEPAGDATDVGVETPVDTTDGAAANTDMDAAADAGIDPAASETPEDIGVDPAAAPDADVAPDAAATE